MKNFYFGLVMAIAMIFGMTQNVSAADGLYTDLEEAQKALGEKCFYASELNSKEDVIMAAEVRVDLSQAYTDAFAVYDSDSKEDINKINEVMPPLLDAIKKAEASIDDYSELTEACTAFYDKEFNAILELSESELTDDEDAALASYLEQLKEVVAKLREGTASPEQLAAVASGKNIREILAMQGVYFPTLEEHMKNPTGIDSVIAAEADNAAEYSLSGSVVSSSYKGIVIKNGKKFIRK